MKYTTIALIILVTAVVAYYVHDYLDKNRNAHPDMK